MFVFVRGWETRQKKTLKTQSKKLLQNYIDAIPSYEQQAKKKIKIKIWHDFIFQVSVHFYFLLSIAASTWKQSLISRKPTCFWEWN